MGVCGKMCRSYPPPNTNSGLWVCGETVAQGSHLTDWGTYTLGIPEGSYGWRRISMRFATKASQTSLPIGLNLVNTCGALYIDDIQLKPVGVNLNAPGVQTSVTMPSQFFTNGSPLTGAISYQVASGADYRLELVMKSTTGKVISIQQSDITGEGVLPIALTIPADTDSYTAITVSLVDGNGKTINQIVRNVSIISTSALNKEWTKLSLELAKFKKQLTKCRLKKIRCDYPTVSDTMATQFLPYIKDDIKANELTRAYENINDVRICIERAQSEIAQALAKPDQAPVVTRYKTSAISIKDGSFDAVRVDSKGRKTSGPVFFTGYGHFYSAT